MMTHLFLLAAGFVSQKLLFDGLRDKGLPCLGLDRQQQVQPGPQMGGSKRSHTVGKFTLVSGDQIKVR